MEPEICCVHHFFFHFNPSTASSCKKCFERLMQRYVITQNGAGGRNQEWMKEGKMVRREPHKSWKDLRRASALCMESCQVAKVVQFFKKV